MTQARNFRQARGARSGQVAAMGEGEHPGLKSVSVLWRRILDGGSDEYCSLRAEAGEACIEGRLVGLSSELEPFFCSYRIAASPSLTASRQLSVRYESGNRCRSLALSRTEAGWAVDGIEPLFVEADEIDLEWSPLTNLFPIRRLIERGGESLTMTAAWVRLSELRVERSTQRYDRIDDRTTRYTNLDSGFSALVLHDEQGFPVNYEGVWESRAHWSD